MPTLTEIQDWNSNLSTRLPPSPVAVFVGATKGIGLCSLRGFVRRTVDLSPRVYFIGRSKDIGDSVVKELQQVNPKGTFVFLPTDVGLMKAVDTTCKILVEREEGAGINFLIMSQAILDLKTETSEGLRYIAAVTMFSRVRFAQNLLPLLQRAHGPKRIVSIFVGTKEGPLVGEDWQCYNVPFKDFRGHGATMTTLLLEELAKIAPDVSFVHNFPGSVKSSLLDNANGWIFTVVKYVSKVFGSTTYMPDEECGDRQTFLATCDLFPPRTSNRQLGKANIAKGTDGKVGSGVYSIDESGNAIMSDKQIEMLEGYRVDGKSEALYRFLQDHFKRICS